jgi:hypothetical protein
MYKQVAEVRTYKQVAMLVLSLAVAAGSAFGQAASNESLKRAAEESCRAFVEGDFGKLADLTYPKLVALLGGRAKMIAFLEDGVREMKAQGAGVLSVTPGEPTQLTTVGRQRFAVVPSTMRLKVHDGVLVGRSFMLGVSGDGGKSWTFVNGDALDERRLKILFPAAAGRLKLPSPEPPTLEKGQP